MCITQELCWIQTDSAVLPIGHVQRFTGEHLVLGNTWSTVHMWATRLWHLPHGAAQPKPTCAGTCVATGAGTNAGESASLHATTNHQQQLMCMWPVRFARGQT